MIAKTTLLVLAAGALLAIPPAAADDDGPIHAFRSDSELAEYGTELAVWRTVEIVDRIVLLLDDQPHAELSPAYRTSAVERVWLGVACDVDGAPIEVSLPDNMLTECETERVGR